MQSEDEVVAQSPLSMKLGGKAYDITPLTLGKAMEWRKKFAPQLSKIMAGYGMQSAAPEDYLLAFVDSAELMTNVVFGYCPNLPEEEILEKATEQEMFQAFAAVMGVAFGPFLGETMFLTSFKKQMEKATASVSEPSSRLQ